jgi:small GTP-binding protein
MNKIAIAFFGKCGAGKTTTINRLFNFNWEIGHAKATTSKAHSVSINLDENNTAINKRDCILKIIDTPGIAESQFADKAYQALYKDIISKIDYIFWLFQADTRTYRSDQIMLGSLEKYLSKHAKIIIGINHIDQIYPGNWDYNFNQPSAEQSIHIKEKIIDVKEKFSKVININMDNIVPYSAKYRYGLSELGGKLFYQQQSMNP